ncbi:MAG: sigma-54-dependent Fis family transcriptional regulator [Calditrichaeota bacterium]|nr:MAG: sigma-54-dependent Fis family transcriptional regulator [Calditrichota bacterium]
MSIFEEKKVLVVDDEPLINSLLDEALSRLHFDVTLATNGLQAIENLQQGEFDLIISDVRLPDLNGMEILNKATEMGNSPGVIMMTAYATVKDAVNAIRKGAYDYITKPFDIDELEIILNKYFKYRQLQRENTILRRQLDKKNNGLGDIVGKSPAMQKIYDRIRLVAQTDSTVLIMGESGTGKELVARAIHNLSDRGNNRFIAPNCAALPNDLMETELFGHEKGAFTGALTRKDGKFMLADKGTILLDEISEMSLHLQAKLLRVLQEREIEPIGSTKTIPIDVRVLASTNCDMQKLVDENKFRDDLFYRLNVVPITLPPLRERKEDIPLLLDHFIEEKATSLKREINSVSRDVYKIFENYDWPGNIRQLSNEVERAIAINNSNELTKEHFEHLQTPALVGDDYKKKMAGMSIADIEKDAIFETLNQFNGNRSQASKSLGISVRTLRNKLKEYREAGVLPDAMEI